MRRFALTMLAGTIIAILFAGTSLAGGWATTEFDEPLPQFTEGGSWLIGFTILQHGVTPAAVDDAGLRFTNKETGEVLFYEAEAQGTQGHYVSSVARLSGGTWSFEVEQGSLMFDGSTPLHFEPYPVGDISIGEAVAVGVRRPQTGRSPVLPIALAVGALSAVAAIGYTLTRRTAEEVA